MKKWMSLFLAMMMVLSLAACGSSKTETKEPETSTAEPAADRGFPGAGILPGRWGAHLPQNGLLPHAAPVAGTE